MLKYVCVITMKGESMALAAALPSLQGKGHKFGGQKLQEAGLSRRGAHLAVAALLPHLT